MSRIHEIGYHHVRGHQFIVDADTLNNYIGYNLVRDRPLRLIASYAKIEAVQFKKGYTIVTVLDDWPYYRREKLSLPPGTKVVIAPQLTP